MVATTSRLLTNTLNDLNPGEKPNMLKPWSSTCGHYAFGPKDKKCQTEKNGIYQINTHYIRCIWGWLLRVPSQGYHHLPYEKKNILQFHMTLWIDIVSKSLKASLLWSWGVWPKRFFASSLVATYIVQCNKARKTFRTSKIVWASKVAKSLVSFFGKPLQLW